MVFLRYERHMEFVNGINYKNKPKAIVNICVNKINKINSESELETKQHKTQKTLCCIYALTGDGHSRPSKGTTFRNANRLAAALAD